MGTHSVSFDRRHRFTGFGVTVTDEWTGSHLDRVVVHLTAPDRDMPGGVLGFRPGIPGFDEASAAVLGDDRERVAELLEWIVETTRVTLDNRPGIDPDQRAYWTRVIDLADQSRAEFFARYPGGMVPAFEVVARLLFDARTLVGAAA